MLKRNIKVFVVGVGNVEKIAMDPGVGFQGLDIEELANAVVFMDDIVSRAKVFIGTEDGRVFESGGEARGDYPLAEKLIGGKTGNGKAWHLEAFA